jgi:poly(3-hydroxybutyrate) depolymerase
MRFLRFLAPLLPLAFLLPSSEIAASEKISRETVTVEGKKRSYYLLVPESVKAPAPLLITLHGSGRNGLLLVEKWKDLATKEGIIVAGPDSRDPQSWKTPEDGPDFLRDLVEAIKAKHPVNPRRVYLFGHSGGAVFALGMSMFESKYFAATAIHAGAWRDPKEFPLMDYAKRKIPLAIMVGDQDRFFPVSDVKATGDRLKQKGFDVEVTVLKMHGHGSYYDKAGKLNEQLWTFLKKHELSEDPEFEQYQFQK